MKPKEILTSKPVSLFGIIGPLIAILAISVCIILSPWFRFDQNALSDLGHPNSDVALIFNLGLIICGILMAPFILGVSIKISNGMWLRKVAFFVFFLASLALIGIGIFTEDEITIHYLFSFAFFVLLLLGALLLGLSTISDNELRIIGIVCFLGALIGIVGWAIDWGGIAIPELLSALPAMLLFIILAIKTYGPENDN